MSKNFYFTSLTFRKGVGKSIFPSHAAQIALQRKSNDLLVNFSMLHYPPRVAPVPWNSCTELPGFGIYWDTENRATAPYCMGYVPYNSRGVDHIDCNKNSTPKVQHTPMKSGTATLSERHWYFPDEHTLTFNQYLLSIYYMYDMDLSSGIPRYPKGHNSDPCAAYITLRINGGRKASLMSGLFFFFFF